MTPDDPEQESPQIAPTAPRPVVRVRRGARRNDRPFTVVGLVEQQAPIASPAPDPRPPAPALASPKFADVPPAPPRPAEAPAPMLSPEEEQLREWLATPILVTAPEHAYEPVPELLAEERRLSSSRRRRRVARQVRAQMLGTGAAMSLAVGGVTAAVIALSQTDQVGGRLGIPSIGLFSASAVELANQDADATKPARSTPKSKPRKAASKPRKAANKPRRAASKPRKRANRSASSSRRARPSRTSPARSAPVAARPPAPAPAARRTPVATPQPKPAPKPAPRPAPRPAPKPAPKPQSTKPSGTGTPSLGTQPGL